MLGIANVAAIVLLDPAGARRRPRKIEAAMPVTTGFLGSGIKRPPS